MYQKLDQEMQELDVVGISSLITNPGYSMISQKILQCLGHKSHLTLRLVFKSWKIQVDCPVFWLKKCVQKGMPKNLQVAWIDLLQRIHSELKLKIQKKKNHFCRTKNAFLDSFNSTKTFLPASSPRARV